jgi:hypothetical protein
MPTSIPSMMLPMSVFRLASTASLVSGVLACAVVVAAQAAPSDPDRFVTSIYANGREGAVWEQWLMSRGGENGFRTR